MTPATPTFSQIKAQVAAIRRKIPDAQIVGIRASGRWTGDRYKQDGADTYLIEQCDSPLAIRMALRESIDERTIKILITSLDGSDLGNDILVRLAKQRLFSIEGWEIVKSLFQAQIVDPRLTQHHWIAEYLMDWVPIDGYPPVSGGFLDAETVWTILLGHGIGLTVDRPDLLSILKWSIDAENIDRYRATPLIFREAIVDWLSGLAGPTVKAVFKCIVANEQPDALPIGLAARVVFHPEVGGRLDRAIGKMEERYLGGTSPNQGMLDRWSAAAAEVVCLQIMDQTQKQRLLKRADEILQEIGAESFSHLSNASPLGFDQRLARFGKCLQSALTHGVPELLEELARLYQAILEHDRASCECRRLERVDMAIRLVRWLFTAKESQSAQPRSLAEAIAYQIDEGSFLDWARLSLRSGDPVRELSEAYTTLFKQIAAIREKQSHQFAELLRDWTAIGSTGEAVIPVEQILESVVAPLVTHTPVLLIVMDGMSMSICRELLTDILAKHDWVSLCQEGHVSAIMAGLAAIPSVTQVSRASLLCGHLSLGNLTKEKGGFASHPALLAHCRNGFPPVLFHKTSLREKDFDLLLADEVRKTIATPQYRVVGVVINAVDDYLLKGEQIDTHWSLDEIKVLSTLLHEASLSQRLVIFLSDHGHVIEYRTQGKSSEGGERWRFDDGQPEDNEFQLSGTRVVIPESKTLIAPWTERFRYGAKKNGYHGGITPQEMVVPIAVLCSTASYPAGWVEAPVDTPSWWEEATLKKVSEMLDSPDIESVKLFLAPIFDSANRLIPDEQMGFRQQVPEWLTALLTSPIYHAQKKLAGRLAPVDDVFIKVLVALNNQGGKITPTMLARSVGCPSTKVQELLTVLQRILNIEGYAILTYNRSLDLVELNQELLCQQFNLLNHLPK
ncbi:MAG: BREX-2 system phosphatase PglZ [Chroococcidiopsidaceae cyanobacterium CP_BM_ER_R8_30]|nr:BREX-2 system phosphatase PglZ [Chroococcidiopsidaceae cyanobacterium CP_BM_ER_R8_30]